MEIPEYFLESEVREGFYVPAKMKRCWASILDVLNEIAIICNRHDIKWWMDWGTMLGLVRHGGYIPWDDDIDISMMRADYDSFLKYAKTELPAEYSIANVYNNHDYIDSLSRVVNNTKLKLAESFLNENHGFPYISGVDIMPIDYMPRDKKVLEEDRDLVCHLHGLATSIDVDALYADVPDYHGNIAYLEGKLNRTFSRTKPLAQQAEIMCQNVLSRVRYEDADYAAQMGAYYTREGFRAVFPKEYYERFIYLNYEFIEVPVPLHYDEMLRKVFGNYMKPYRAGGTHDYPVYCKQEAVLLDEIGEAPWMTCRFETIEGIKSMDDYRSDEDKKDVIFLVTRASNWVFMKKEYEKAAADQDNNVYVIPIPYYYRTNTLGISEEVRYEAAELSRYTEITGFDKYDFFGKRPDVVYFDTPYDTYDAHIVVHPMFYTNRLRVFSKKLIYVSCILTDDYGSDDEKARSMMEFCINTPGVARADEVIVQSECMRARYIESLTEWAGENTREMWEKKIVSCGVTRSELPEYPPVSDEELAPEWLEVLRDKNGNRKKLILVYISISALMENSSAAIGKLERVFGLFKENTESVMMYYHPDINIDKYLGQFDENLYKEYKRVIDGFISEDYGIFDDGEDDSFMVRLCDGFYGNNGNTMYHFMRAEKPVMVMDFKA